MKLSSKLVASTGALILGLSGMSYAAEQPQQSGGTQSQSGQQTGQPETIQGEIEKVQNNVYTIKNQQGERLRLRIEQSAIKGKSLHKGDMVKAKVMKNDESFNVISAKKASGQSASAQSSSKESSQSKMVTGKVQKVEGEVYTIKNEQGKDMQVKIEPHALQGASLQKGDKVEAEIRDSGKEPHTALYAEKAEPSSSMQAKSKSGSMSSSQQNSQSDQQRGKFTKTVRGKVQKVQGNVYYIQDQSGKEVRLRLDESAKKEGEIQKGDTIEALVTKEKEFHVISAESASSK